MMIIRIFSLICLILFSSLIYGQSIIRLSQIEPIQGTVIKSTGETVNKILTTNGSGGSTWQAQLSIADYIQNQNAAAQTANICISGTGRFGNYLSVESSAPYLLLKTTQSSGNEYRLWNSYNSNGDLVLRNETLNSYLLRFPENSNSATFYANVSAPTFQSTVATGTAPLTVESTTLVSNLNADLLDGQHASYYQSQINGTGFVKATGDVISYDNSSYANLALANTFTADQTISSTATTKKLVINAGNSVPGMGGGMMEFKRNGTVHLYMGTEGAIYAGSGGTGGVVGTQYNSSLFLVTNATKRLTINGNGRVLINTSTDNGSSFLQVSGTVAHSDGTLATHSATLGQVTGILLTAGSTSIGTVRYAGTTNTAGQFYGGTTTPTGTTRLNYSGYFYPTFLNLLGSGDTGTGASHYFVETGSDGYVRPKTIADVKTELVVASEVLTKINTVDGTGSGLDADLLNGQHGSYYSPTTHGHGTIYNTSISDLNTLAYPSLGLFYGTYISTAANNPYAPDNANGVITMVSHGSGGSGTYGKQIAFPDNDDLYIRKFVNGTFGSWYKLYHSGNTTIPTNTNQLTNGAGFVSEAPVNGNSYVRKDTEWVLQDASKWTSHANGIYNTSTSVGIGQTPTNTGYRLWVNGSTFQEGTLNMSDNSIKYATTVQVAELASMSGYDSGYGTFYGKTDGKPYYRSGSGVEYDLTATGSSMVYPAAGIALSNGSAWAGSITNNSGNWNTGYSERATWDGGTSGLVAATGRTSLSLEPGSITYSSTNSASGGSHSHAISIYGTPSNGNTLTYSSVYGYAWGNSIPYPGGSSTHVQYNNGISFAGSSSFTFNSGTGVVTATNFALSSDRKLKRSIQPIGENEWVDDIHFKSFYMKNDKSDNLRYGVIAQEIEKINRYLVTSDEETGLKAVNYTDLLIAKVARQDDLMRELEKRLTKLERRK